MTADRRERAIEAAARALFEATRQEYGWAESMTWESIGPSNRASWHDPGDPAIVDAVLAVVDEGGPHTSDQAAVQRAMEALGATVIAVWPEWDELALHALAEFGVELDETLRQSLRDKPGPQTFDEVSHFDFEPEPDVQVLCGRPGDCAERLEAEAERLWANGHIDDTIETATGYECAADFLRDNP